MRQTFFILSVLFLWMACDDVNKETVDEQISTEEKVRLLNERTGLEWKEVNTDSLRNLEMLYIPYDSLIKWDWSGSE